MRIDIDRFVGIDRFAAFVVAHDDRPGRGDERGIDEGDGTPFHHSLNI